MIKKILIYFSIIISISLTRNSASAQQNNITTIKNTTIKIPKINNNISCDKAPEYLYSINNNNNINNNSRKNKYTNINNKNKNLNINNFLPKN